MSQGISLELPRQSDVDLKVITLPVAGVRYNKDKKTVQVGDGITPGGRELAYADGSNLPVDVTAIGEQVTNLTDTVSGNTTAISNTQEAVTSGISAVSANAVIAAAAATNATASQNAAAASQSDAATAASTAASNAASAASNASNAASAATTAAAAQTAAQAANTTAQTAATNAASANSAAQSAASDASAAQSAAQAAQTAALAAQTTAQTAATNASTSAATATTQATNASNSASAASGYATTAGTAATNAATANTNAQAAQTAAQSAQAAATTSVASLFPSTFQQNGSFFTLNYTANCISGTVNPITSGTSGITFPTVTAVGTVLQAAGSRVVLGTLSYLTLVTGRTYSITGSAITTVNASSGANPDVQLTYAAYDSTGAHLGYTVLNRTAALSTSSGVTALSATFTTANVLSAFSTAAYVRPIIVLNDVTGSAATGSTQQLYNFVFADVTESTTATTAANSANTYASNAASSQSAAASSASAANTSATNASTSAGNASTSATNAANSATSASGSASTASTQATNAANSATAAGTSATAASGSASSAATSASAAGTSATAAQGYATTATTQAGNASTSAGQASTSATNAAGSATSASTSQTAAANSASQAALTAAALLPSDFQNDGQYWASGSTGSPASLSPITAATGGGSLFSFVTVSGVGRVMQIVSTGVNSGNFETIGAIKLVSGARYRATLTYRQTSGTLGTLNIQLNGLDSSYAYVSTSGANIIYAASPAALNTLYSAVVEIDATTSIAAGGVYGRPIVSPQQSGLATYQVVSVKFEDITQSYAAGNSASAAATSASNAATSNTAAGASASAANTSATNAATSAGAASTSAGQASTSATNAAGSANTASTQATNAANSATSAAGSSTAASGYASTASTQATNAANSATSASNSATSASGYANTASSQAANAASSASAASASASNASTSATNAANSASSATTSANTATTQAGNASTSAGQAATSATNAAGSASTASTQATNAANSATAAGGSATAASGSASTAATQATNAANSATASQASSVSASSSAAALFPSDFQSDGKFWFANYVGSPSSVSPLTTGGVFSFVTVTGIGRVLQVVSTTNYDGLFASIGAIKMVAGSRYRATLSYQQTSGSLGQVQVSLSSLDSTYSYYSGTGSNQTTHVPSALNTVYTFTQDLDATTVIASGGVYLRPVAYPFQGAHNATYQFISLKFEDVTQSYAASNSATAAASSASSASSSQTAAAASASAASSSATLANTYAGNAATSASSASTSASNAAGSANTASTQATNSANSATAAAGSSSAASGYASTATTQASNAATSATNASNSATSAQGYANTASSQAANALSSANAASTSASGAATSASNAATSASASQTSSVSANLTAAQLFPSDFQQDGLYWTQNYIPTSAAAATSIAAGSFNNTTISFVTVSGVGRVMQMVWATNSYFLWGTVGLLKLTSGSRHRATLTFQQTSGTLAGVNMCFNGLSTSYGIIGGSSGYAGSTTVTASALNTLTTFAIEFNDNDPLGSGGTYARVCVLPTGAGTFQFVTLKVEDITQSYAASNSATAAATSASSAASSNTAAGVSASAASTSATNAATSAGNAATSASSASTSASNALGYSNTASTQATNAANSASAAGTSASAASTSASTASTQASNAATSASNAATSANAANSSSVSASLTAAQLLPPDFQQDGKFWQTAYTGSPASATPITANSVFSFATVSGIGRVMQVLWNSSALNVFGSIGAVKLTSGSRYRATLTYQQTAGTLLQVQLYALGLDASYGFQGVYSLTTYTTAALNTTYSVSVDADASTMMSSGAVYVRPYLNIASGSATFQFASLSFVDITQSYSAAGSATAAASSASSASASQTAAATSATSASNSATTATTQAGNASTYASNASTSASNALGYSNTASTQAGNAATSATNAGNSATAAAGSASTATTQASNAASSASSASASANTASTQAGNASTSAAGAATSATNASGSASSAATSASTSASSAAAAKLTAAQLLPSDFQNNGQFWCSGYTGSPPSTGTSITANSQYSFPTVSGVGTVMQANSAGYYDGAFSSIGAVKLVGGSRYRTTITYRQTSGTLSAVYYGNLISDSSYAYQNNYFAISTPAALNTWYTYVAEVDATTAIAAGGVYVRPALWPYSGNTTTFQVASAKFEDITQSYAASNSASAAATSASNAAISQTAAGSSASAANTSATNAATSAGNASTYASNASTSASNASTSSSSAAGSASTATSQATLAASSAAGASTTAAYLLPSDFQLNGQFWSTCSFGGAAPSSLTSLVAGSGNYNTTISFPNISGYGTALQVVYASNSYLNLTPIGDVKLISGSRHRATLTFRQTAGTLTAVQMNLLLEDYTHATLGGIGGGASASVTPSALNTWYTVVVEADDAYSMGSGGVYTRAWVSYPGLSATYQYLSLKIEDITQSYAAANSASAAASSASAASISQTAAGSSATSASSSATAASTSAGNASASASTATTQASNASTSATNASNSASSATSSANTASTQAGNASTSASAASTSAASASSSAASAATSAILSAQVGLDSLTYNAVFANWPVGQTLPTGYADDSNSTGNITKATGQISANAFQLAGIAGQNNSIQSPPANNASISSPSYFVLEADITLVSGSLVGGGLILCGENAGGSDLETAQLSFSTDKDISDSVIGSGTVGATYRYRKLVQLTNTSSVGLRLKLCSHNPTFGSVASANSIRFHRADARAASSAEIAGSRADTNATSALAQIATTNTTVASNASAQATINTSVSSSLSTNSAAITSTSTALTTLSGQVYSSYVLKANANGNIASMSLLASGGATPVSSVIFEAANFQIKNSTSTAITPFTYDATSGTLFLQNITVQTANIATANITTLKLATNAASAPTVQTIAVANPASGTITVSNGPNVTDGDTITIASETYTFRNSPTLATDIGIGSGLAVTIASNIAAVINFHSSYVTAFNATGTNVVSIFSQISGTTGNSYTFSQYYSGSNALNLSSFNGGASSAQTIPVGTVKDISDAQHTFTATGGYISVKMSIRVSTNQTSNAIFTATLTRIKSQAGMSAYSETRTCYVPNFGAIGLNLDYPAIFSDAGLNGVSGSVTYKLTINCTNGSSNTLSLSNITEEFLEIKR